MLIKNNDSDFTGDMISEGWKKEYEKYLLTKKYYIASDFVSDAITDPTINNIKKAYGVVSNYISSIPIGKENIKKERDELFTQLKPAELILFGNPTMTNVVEARKKLGMGLIRIRQGNQYMLQVTDLPLIAIELRNILVNAGDFAVMCGLRISLSEKKPKGKQKLLEEEGFDSFEETKQ